MFLRPRRSLADWLAAPEFARILDAAPGAVAVCDRDGAALAASGALRRATGTADPSAGLAALLPDLAHALGQGRDRPAQTSVRPVSVPGQAGAGAMLSPILENEGGIAGYWVQLSPPADPPPAPEGPVLRTDGPLAYAEVDRSGRIRTANAPFHDLLCAPAGSLTERSLRALLARPAEADALTACLRDGGDPSGDYAMAAGGGGDVWLSLQFLPLATPPTAAPRLGVVARCVTAARQKAVNDAAILAALSRSQAAIEFTPDGTILTANENFLKALGYARAADVVGRHHRLFVFPEDQRTQDYARFWRRLASGEFFTGKFRRVTRTGAEIWIEASYNPVFRADGSVAKIVKFAQDVTPQMTVSRKVSASLGMVEAVAAAAEEMSSSISAISGTMQGSRDAVTTISQNIAQSVSLAGELTQSAESMERVIGLIRTIAETVNLLALNATIEAARAGPAGRSFAVVAAEVKTLAAQTNDAIGEIAREIKQMQAVSNDVRRTVDEITLSAARLSDSVGTLASALSEQTMATSEIARNIAVVAGGVSELNDLLAT